MTKSWWIQIGLFGLLMLTGCGREPAGPISESAKAKGLSLDQTSAVSQTAEQAAELPTGEDWPCWMGPRQDGVSSASDWSWTGSEVPPIVWRTNVGTGFSSLAVVGNRLYTMGRWEDQEQVVCLDTADGNVIWRHAYSGDLIDVMHEGGPGATPTVDGDFVFTLGREGQLHGLRAENGKQIWSRSVREDAEVDFPAWGFTCSPLVLGDLVIVDAGRTMAYNKATGEKIWQTALYEPGYGTPRAFRRGDEHLLAVLNNDYLLILRADDGLELAKEKWETSYNTSSTTPVVEDDLLYISTGYRQGCAQLRFDGQKLEVVYENQEMCNHFNNSVLYDRFLFGIDGQSNSSRTCRLVCMDWMSGEVRWSQRGFGCGSVLVAGDKLIVLSDEGRLIVAEASGEKYAELATAPILEGRCWTVPVLVRGHLYARNTAGDLVCLDLEGA